MKRRTLLQRNDAKSVAGIVGCVLLAIYVSSLLAILIWGVISSMKGPLDFQLNLFGLPKKYHFENYTLAFEELFVLVKKSSGVGKRKVRMFEMLFWSVLTSTVPAIINVVFTALCSYTLAKYKFALRNTIYNVLIFVMILPIVNSLPSSLEFTHKIGMYDFLPWLLVTSCTIWTGEWMILYAIYKSISWEYAEAAFIDGAGHHRVFWTIMIPMSIGPIFVLILLSFITRWNDYQFSLIWYPSYPTLAYGLYYFQFTSAQAASSEPIQIAAAILSAVPCLALFMIFKEKMMNSLTMGGLKG